MEGIVDALEQFFGEMAGFMWDSWRQPPLARFFPP